MMRAKEYNKGGALVSQALSAIKTVVGLVGEEKKLTNISVF